MPLFSVVIATYNRAQLLCAALDSVFAQRCSDYEVIVVDGGSDDDTLARAQSVEGVRVIQAPRGRASQLNAGATTAQGDVLLFLHADVRLPSHAVGLVHDALEDPTVVGGAFRISTP